MKILSLYPIIPLFYILILTQFTYINKDCFFFINIDKVYLFQYKQDFWLILKMGIKDQN
jgi:hypothetical protein